MYRGEQVVLVSAQVSDEFVCVWQSAGKRQQLLAVAHDDTTAGTYTAEVCCLSAACLLPGCLQDFCPCESQCTNQMFTRKQYAKVAVVSSSCLALRAFLNQPPAAGVPWLTVGSAYPAVQGLADLSGGFDAVMAVCR
jgi:hypothetical protein